MVAIKEDFWMVLLLDSEVAVFEFPLSVCIKPFPKIRFYRCASSMGADIIMLPGTGAA